MISNNVGIYQIRNLVNGKIYIGSSNDLKSRKRDHFYRLRINKHKNPHLQNAYNKYGKENFVFEPVVYCLSEYLLQTERVCINNFKANYNICSPEKTRLGIKHTPETLKFFSECKKGKNNPNAKKVINVETGVIYDTIKETALENNMTEAVLGNNLFGRYNCKNKTPFKLYSEYLKEDK